MKQTLLNQRILRAFHNPLSEKEFNGTRYAEVELREDDMEYLCSLLEMDNNIERITKQRDELLEENKRMKEKNL